MVNEIIVNETIIFQWNDGQCYNGHQLFECKEKGYLSIKLWSICSCDFLIGVIHVLAKYGKTIITTQNSESTACPNSNELIPTYHRLGCPNRWLITKIEPNPITSNRPVIDATCAAENV